MATRVSVAWAGRADRGLGDHLVCEEASRGFGVPEHDARVIRLCPSCGSNAHGRPMLAPVPGLTLPQVSISRAGSVTVVALTLAGPVGVDVERTDAAGFAGYPGVAMHPAERSASARERTVTWVRKEALLKATGHGLVLDATDLRMTEPADPPAVLEWPAAGAPPHAQMYDVETAPGHVTAVAVLTGSSMVLEVRKAAPAARSRPAIG